MYKWAKATLMGKLNGSSVSLVATPMVWENHGMLTDYFINCVIADVWW